MASRKNRLDRILEIIAQNEIQTQGELADILVQEGYNVTQATVSRDIRKLRLQKTRIPGGRQKYIAPERREDSQETVRRSLCIAGDDTIMAAVRSAEDTKALMSRIREMLQK